MPHFCSPSRSSTASYSQETKTADVRFVTKVVIKYLRLCIFVPPIPYKTCYFAFIFQHLADAFTTVEGQRKEEYKLNSKAVQFTPSIFSKSAQTQLQKTKHKSVNTVIRQKSIGIQTCLPCQHEVKGAVKDTVEELVLNVENQFIDDAFDRESVNTSKSEYETEYDTEYEPDSSFQLDQSTCLSDEQVLEREHLEEQLPSNNSAFIVYWSSLILLLQYCLSCPAKALVNSVFIQGSAVVVELICEDGHISLWRSQQQTSNFYEGNIVLAVSILFSANTFSKIKNYFELACIPFISHTSYYNLQKDYLFGVANEA